jgi:predicted RNA polymerase sigma factor
MAAAQCPSSQFVYLPETRTIYRPENQGQPYTDDEMRLILSCAPTRANAQRLAVTLKRRPGAIEQIYRWAGQSNARIASARGRNKFIRQIQRIRKELGWLVYGDNRGVDAEGA